MNVHALLSGEDRRPVAALLRLALTPLAAVHQIGLEGYLLPYRLGVRKRARLPVPTIAIGNLTSGGTGKTPMAALVAQELRRQGARVVLLSRGHGGSQERGQGAQIVSRGDGQTLLTPETAGDEPVLLARLLPDVPVVIGRDRRVSGRLALAEFDPDVVLLDDALQFWQLERDLDIVLLDARRPFDNGYLLPRGLLREPPSHLARAGVVVLTRADRVDAAQRHRLLEEVGRLAPRSARFCAVHAPQEWVGADGSCQPLEALRGSSRVAIAGIADNASFFLLAQSLGIRIVQPCSFADHHTYNNSEVAALAHCAEPQGAITTEKDLTKIAPLWPVSGPPLQALRVSMQLDDPAALGVILERTWRRHPDDSHPLSRNGDR